jgi:formylglycine-generating enzyme required for sulfatase activity
MIIGGCRCPTSFSYSPQDSDYAHRLEDALKQRGFEVWIDDRIDYGARYSPRGDSPYGCADMAGDVWEWTRSVYAGYPYDPQDGREDPGAAAARVIRGGAFHYDARQVRSAHREHRFPDLWSWNGGFRVCIATQQA